jgi:hypothetical protein
MRLSRGAAVDDKRDDLFGSMTSDLEAAADVTEQIMGGKPPSRRRLRNPDERPSARRRGPRTVPKNMPRSRAYGEHGGTPGGLLKRTILVEPELWDAVEDFKREHFVRSASAIVRDALREYLERHT